MNSAVLTGPTSYLGTALVKRLAGTGVETHLVVRPRSDVRPLQEHVGLARVHVHDGTTEGLIGIIQHAKPDIVFHLAATYRREHLPGDVEALIRSNVEFGTQLLEAIRLCEPMRMVNTGSYFQWYDGERALNLYAATKQAFQAIVDYYTDAYGLETITLVLFDVYGPGDRRDKLISAILESLHTGNPLSLPTEDPVLDLVHVQDVVSAFVQAAELLEGRPGDVRGRYFAVSSGERRRLSEILEVFEELSGRTLACSWGAFRTPERRIREPWQGDPLPGWRPQVSLRDGLADLLDTAGEGG